MSLYFYQLIVVRIMLIVLLLLSGCSKQDHKLNSINDSGVNNDYKSDLENDLSDPPAYFWNLNLD
ncbi:hypothetical protein IHI24_000079 [Rickettsia endosymbiont of Cardiosporidium cionae]|nr:hypothetical protein IHI24_000079 [Rickettsia endosymbiont of Cardiosporidium cionae]